MTVTFKIQPVGSPKPVIGIEQLDHFFDKGELRKQVLFGINLLIASGEIVKGIKINTIWTGRALTITK